MSRPVRKLMTTRRRTQEKSDANTDCPLQRLQGTVLGQLWPCERVIMGMRVSNWLREELIASAHGVVFKTEMTSHAELNKFSRGGADSVCTDLQRFEQLNQVLWLEIEIGIDLTIHSRPVLRSFWADLVKSMNGTLKKTLKGIKLRCNSNVLGIEARGLAWALRQCESLTSIEFDSGTAQLLPWMTKLNASTFFLRVSECGVDESSAKNLAKAIAGCQSLEVLDLKKNAIGDGAACLVAESLKGFSRSLIEIDLSSNKIGDAGACHLAKSLRNLSRLTHLNLSRNKIGAMGALTLVEALKSSGAQLCSVNLSDNDFGPSVEVAVSLSDLLRSAAKSLRKLDLSGLEMGHDTLIEVGDALQQCKKLISLNLSGNTIGDAGMARLGKSLQAMSFSLTSLSLVDSEIGVDGAKELACVLFDCKALVLLFLGSNKLGNRGMKVLIPALKQCKKLEALDLSSNKIGDEGAEFLCEKLLSFQALTNLFLHNNELGAKSAERLATVLRKRDVPLEDLMLEANQIGDLGARHLQAALSTCEQLNLCGNGLSNKMVGELFASWKRLGRCATKLEADTVGPRGQPVLTWILPEPYRHTFGSGWPFGF